MNIKKYEEKERFYENLVKDNPSKKNLYKLKKYKNLKQNGGREIIEYPKHINNDTIIQIQKKIGNIVYKFNMN